jgi:signal transduction histidine kinase/CheY-like chemotaxis protein
MANFHGWSLQRKLAALIVGTCAGALLLSCLALVGWQYYLSRSTNDARSVELAEVIASNVAPAIMFADDRVALETASSLAQVNSVSEVRVLDVRRRQLASYLRQGRGRAEPTATADYSAWQTSRYQRGQQLHIIVPARVGGDHVGYVEVFVETESIAAMFSQYLGVALVVFLVALGCAAITSRRTLSNLFVSMDGLMLTMRRLRSTPDYGMRVTVPAEPDISGIFEGFNALMADMQDRDDRLARAIDDLKAARDQAEAANVAKSQFLSNMSHELRTPLNAIIAYADLVQEDLEAQGESQMVDDVRIIASSSRHLLHLINDILDFAKIEAGKAVLDLHAFDVSVLINEVAAVLEPLAVKQGNKLHLQLDTSLGEVVLDSVKLKQSLLNLGGNACKFTKGGHVVISARADEANNVIIAVSDTGIGMTDLQVDGLFQPFNQGDASTTRKFGGTGLGLTITRQFVEMMQGRIDVSSVPEVGTTFTITLPQRVEDGAIIVANPDAAVETNAGERIALIIDDEPTARDVIARWLHPHGYTVRTAENGQEGLAKARSLKPSIILLDIGMPQVDGWDVLRALREDSELSNIPTIVTTIDDRRRLGLELGATEYLRKPLDRDQLLDIVNTYCEKAIGRVLLVEDDPTTADLYLRGLRQAGYHVTHAADGQLAIDAMVAESPFDLVIADLMMPNVDGFELINGLQNRPDLHNLPVLVITAKNLDRGDHDRLAGKVERILPKTGLSPRQIVQAVQESMISSRKAG